MDKRNKNNLITNKEYERRLKIIDNELNRKDISKMLSLRLEYTKKSILDTLYNREYIK
jgi:hypothetical protein